MMYDENFQFSSRYVESKKALVNAAIDRYNESVAKPEESKKRKPTTSEMNNRVVLEHVMQKENVAKRYHSFVETVKHAIVVESLYNLYKKAAPGRLVEDANSRNVMRTIVTGYVQEQGYDAVLRKMETASVAMSEMHNLIENTIKSILEEVDKTDDSTFIITPQMKDNFFANLDYSDTQAIADVINDRVSDAIQDFIDSNVKDHEEITSVLQKAQDKVADMNKEDKELREFYEMKAKRQITECRSAAKGLFHSMVSTVSENVVKNNEVYAEFLDEGHLDLNKIIDRVSLSYTFLEMLNTTRLEKIDNAYVENVLESLAE